MAEKRFTFTQDTLAKADVFDEDEFVCCTLSVWVEQLVDLLNQLNDENEQLQQELFESEEECLMVDYRDNPVRRDAYIELLKEHFKKRFGRDFE